MQSKKITLLAFCIMFVLTVSPSLSLSATGVTLDVRVNASSDDAEEVVSTGAVNLTGNRLDMPYDSQAQVIGIRFQDIDIPAGVTITKAYIEFDVYDTSSGATNLTFWGQASNDAPTFSTTNQDITGRSKTTHSVSWNVPNWNNSHSQHISPDLKEIVQEIIDLGGWAEGHAMAFIIGGNGSTSKRMAETYDYDHSDAPLLHIEYTGTAIDVYPLASSDDAEEEDQSNDVTLNSPDLDLNRNPNIDTNNKNNTVGIRFPNVTIPPGSTITSAYLAFTADEASNNTQAKVRIVGQAIGDALAFTSTSGNISDRDTTNAKVNWNLPKFQNVHNEYTSPEISAIVQEIVGRSDWSSGKAIALILTKKPNNSGNGTRAAESYDGASAHGDLTLRPRLHIEYSAPPAEPFITVDKNELGATCYVNSSPNAGEFTISNTGTGSMSYTLTETVDWLTLSSASGTLAVGESVTISVSFNTSAMAAGTYETLIKVTDPNATNNPVEIDVSVTIFELPVDNPCDNVPLYAQDIVHPSILILLDVSGSMRELMEVSSDTEQNPRTPDLKDIVQEIVNREAWNEDWSPDDAEANAMAFIISGTGRRSAVSYNGDNGEAPLLHVAFNDGTEDHELSIRVNQSSDDAEQSSNGDMSVTSSDLELVKDGNDTQTVGIRFRNVTIPQGATITSAYIEFTVDEAGSEDTDLVIKGQDSDDAPTFASGWNNRYNITNRTTTDASVSWSNVEEWAGRTKKQRIEIGRDAISNLVKDRNIAWGFGSWTDHTTSGYTSTIDYTKIHEGCEEYSTEHQNSLQNAIASVTPLNRTPFKDSLEAAKKYFAGQKADLNGDDYPETDCDQLFLIDVTDGLGNTGTTVENVTAEANNLADAGINTAVVGFGIDDATQINAVAATANARGKASDTDDIFALHPEVGGVGVPFIANNEVELVNVLSSIVDNVKASLFHGAAPAPTTTADLGNLLLLASFDATDWSGDLKAYAKDANGEWEDTPEWAAQFPASRNIFTIDPDDHITVEAYSNYLTDYLSCKDMGDIINSTPVVVNNPSHYFNFDGYKAWAKTIDRDSLVYVGANDGALHAFSLENGSEQWAFVPESLQAKLKKGDSDEATYDSAYAMCDTDYCHQYFVDGSPQVSDIYTKASDEEVASWKTVLVSGLGEGGESYFALNITSGNLFNAGTDPSKYMWEFTDTDLGLTMSEPSINRVSAGSDSTVWGVFFGSGYASTMAAQVTKQAYLYGILAQNNDAIWNDGAADIKKVKVFNKILLRYDGLTADFRVNETITGASSNATATIASIDAARQVLEIKNVSGTFTDNETINGNGATAPGQAVVNGTVQDALTDDALATPLVAEIDDDEIADQIYVGNLYGTMFRVSKIGFAQTPQVTTLLDLDRTANNINPIRSKACYAYSEIENEIWVYWGTGIYETQADKTNKSQQYFFGVKDSLGATGETSLASMAALQAEEYEYTDAEGHEKTFMRINGSNADKKSWYIKLGISDYALGSERVIRKGLVAGGTVFFTTLVPKGDTCSGSGQAWLYAVDYETGLPPVKPVFDINEDGKIDDDDLIKDEEGNIIPIVGIQLGDDDGLASSPVLNGAAEMLVNLTEGGMNSIDVNLPELSVRLESWRHEF